MATAWSGFSPEEQAKIKLELDANRPASKNLTKFLTNSFVSNSRLMKISS